MTTMRLGLFWLMLSQGATVTVESLPFEPSAWKDAPRAEAKVTENGQVVVYSGVPLRVVLKEKLPEGASMAGLRGLADAVLLVSATDGYQVAVSAAAAAMDAKGERYLLALERDGKPLDSKVGPVRLIVPGDTEHVRWVRNVSGVDLIRLPRKNRK